MPQYKSDLLTRKEAFRYLNISASSLDRLVQRKLLPAIRFGGNVRFLKADLDAFIDRSRQVDCVLSIS